MRSYIIVLSFVVLAVIGTMPGCGKKSAPTGGSGTPATAHSRIIDHGCIELSRIPVQWINAARANLRVTFGHTSHGSQLPTGMVVLRDSLAGYQYFNDHYYYDTGSGSPAAAGMLSFWDGVPGGDLGNPDRVTWKGLTDTMLSNVDGAYAVYPHFRNVVMWSWCGQVGWADTNDIVTYLSLMTQLEQSYPSVTFVYMTGHLDGSGAAGNLNVRNQQIRAYCRANNKVLFDFADIESYDPNGLVNYMTLNCTDGCNYDSSGTTVNWAASWVARNPNHELTRLANACGSCAHSEQLNCIMKARAFWWMMARLAGWDGT
jgi:hypothetical protein